VRFNRAATARIGLVPRQDSTGGKQKLGPISKQGDRYFRRMRSGCCACAATALPSPAIKSCRRNGFTPHSINLAVANSVSGIVRPRFLAVFILITSSNLLGWITGRSEGFSPLRIRPV
jgi:hypothetical protein